MVSAIARPIPIALPSPHIFADRSHQEKKARRAFRAGLLEASVFPGHIARESCRTNAFPSRESPRPTRVPTGGLRYMFPIRSVETCDERVVRCRFTRSTKGPKEPKGPCGRVGRA